MLRTPFEIPRLDENRCTGCGDCIAICPANCLELRGRIAWLPRPLDCISCGVCESICAEKAISMNNIGAQ